MIIKYLPGDLIEFNDQSILIIAIGYSREAPCYYYFQADSDKPIFKLRQHPTLTGGYIDAEASSNLLLMTDFRADTLPIEKISHLFDFNIYNSAVCRGGLCFPRKITGECSGCPLGYIISSSKVSNLYLPGDQVYMITEKEVREVVGMCLTVKSYMTDDRRSGGFANFNANISSNRDWYLSMFARLFTTHPHIDRMTLPEAWEILKRKSDCETKPRFYVEGERSGRWGEQIRLRQRGHSVYLNESDLDTVCGMCIYQRGMEICDDCSVEKLRKKIYG